MRLQVDADHADERHVARAALLLRLDRLSPERVLREAARGVLDVADETGDRHEIERDRIDRVDVQRRRRAAALLQPAERAAHDRRLVAAVLDRLLVGERRDLDRERQVLRVKRLLLRAGHAAAVVVAGQHLTVPRHAVALRAEDLHHVRQREVGVLLDVRTVEVHAFRDGRIASLRKRRDLDLLLPVDRLPLDAADDVLELQVLLARGDDAVMVVGIDQLAIHCKICHLYSPSLWDAIIRTNASLPSTSPQFFFLPPLPAIGFLPCGWADGFCFTFFFGSFFPSSPAPSPLR